MVGNYTYSVYMTRHRTRTYYRDSPSYHPCRADLPCGCGLHTGSSHGFSPPWGAACSGCMGILPIWGTVRRRRAPPCRRAPCVSAAYFPDRGWNLSVDTTPSSGFPHPLGLAGSADIPSYSPIIRASSGWAKIKINVYHLHTRHAPSIVKLF